MESQKLHQKLQKLPRNCIRMLKAGVFDGWACLGTANWDRLSFRINRELNVSTSHSSTVAQLHERLFELDFARSVEITEPFPERWSDHLIEVLGDYIF
jgi:cardiolipin synthase